MKCLSIHQPWADLEVEGRRGLEIRKWSHPHRGPLLIHAGLKVEKEECKRLGVIPSVTGAIIGLVHLVDIRLLLSENEWERLRSKHLEAGGRCYGDQTYGWFLEKAYRFPKAIPFRGVLGVFEVNERILPKRLSA
jgi:hypothetical protein